MCLACLLGMSTIDQQVFLRLILFFEELGDGLSGCPKLSLVQVGLLYDEVALQNVLDLTFDWTQEEREMLRKQVQ